MNTTSQLLAALLALSLEASGQARPDQVLSGPAAQQALAQPSSAACSPLASGIYVSVHGGGLTLLHALDVSARTVTDQDGQHGQMDGPDDLCRHTLSYANGTQVRLVALGRQIWAFSVRSPDGSEAQASGLLVRRPPSPLPLASLDQVAMREYPAHRRAGFIAVDQVINPRLGGVCPIDAREAGVRRYHAASDAHGYIVVLSSARRGVDCLGWLPVAQRLADEGAS